MKIIVNGLFRKMWKEEVYVHRIEILWQGGQPQRKDGALYISLSNRQRRQCKISLTELSQTYMWHNVLLVLQNEVIS
jgi:hypothetical protein